MLFAPNLSEFSKRLVGTALVTTFVFQTILSDLAQAGLWEERRTAHAVGAPGRLAAAMPQLPPLSSVRENLTSASPHFSRTGSALQAKLLELAPGVAHMSREFPAQGPMPKGLAVIVQDIHQNTESEKNISTLLRRWIESGSVGLVALEGVFDNADLSRFTRFPHRGRLEAVADYYLANNGISGPVHAVVVSGVAMPIAGIDDRARYDANVAAFLSSQHELKKAQALLHHNETELAGDLEKPNSPALLRALKDNRAYHRGTLGLVDYVGSFAEEDRRDAENTNRFVAASKLERTLDLTRIEKERSNLARQLSEKMSREQMSALAAHGVAFQRGQLNETQFYTALQKMAEAAGVRLDTFPAFRVYLNYLQLSRAIDPHLLFEEIEQIERRIFKRVATTPEQSRLVLRTLQVGLEAKLIEFALTPQEWKMYAEMTEAQPAPSSDQPLDPFKRFYREAVARDISLQQNALATLKRAGSATKASAFVVGGFHATELATSLSAKGYTVLVLTPKITSVDLTTGSAYLNAFLQEKTPLGKLFSGQKLFVRPNPLEAMAEMSVAPLSGLGLAEANRLAPTLLPERTTILEDITSPGDGPGDRRVATTHVKAPNQKSISIKTQWEGERLVSMTTLDGTFSQLRRWWSSLYFADAQPRRDWRARLAFFEELFYSGVFLWMAPWILNQYGITDVGAISVRTLFYGLSIVSFAFRHPDIWVWNRQGHVVSAGASTLGDKIKLGLLGGGFRALFLIPGFNPATATAVALTAHFAYNVVAALRGWMLAMSADAPQMAIEEEKSLEESTSSELQLMEADYGFLPNDNPAQRFAVERLNTLLYDVPQDRRPSIHVLSKRGEGINAMAFPTGVIIVTPELMEAIEFVEEFDFIVLHEARHIANADSLHIASQVRMLKQLGALRKAEYRSDAQPFWQMSEPERQTTPLGAITLLERLRSIAKSDFRRVRWDVAHGNISDRILNLKFFSQILNFSGLDRELTRLPLAVTQAATTSSVAEGGALSRLLINPSIRDSNALRRRTTLSEKLKQPVTEDNIAEVKALALGVLNKFQKSIVIDSAKKNSGSEVTERRRQNLLFFAEAILAWRRVMEWEEAGGRFSAADIALRRMLSLELEAGLTGLTNPSLPIFEILKSIAINSGADTPEQILRTTFSKARRELSRRSSLDSLAALSDGLTPYATWTHFPSVLRAALEEAFINGAVFDKNGSPDLEDYLKSGATLFHAAHVHLTARAAMSENVSNRQFGAAWTVLVVRTAQEVMDTKAWPQAWEPKNRQPAKNPYLALVRQSAGNHTELLKLDVKTIHAVLEEFSANAETISDSKRREWATTKIGWLQTIFSAKIDLEAALTRINKIINLFQSNKLSWSRASDRKKIAELRLLWDTLPTNIPAQLMESTFSGGRSKIAPYKDAILNEMLSASDHMRTLDAVELYLRLSHLATTDPDDYWDAISYSLDHLPAELLTLDELDRLRLITIDFIQTQELTKTEMLWAPAEINIQTNPHWARRALISITKSIDVNNPEEGWKIVHRLTTQWRVPSTDLSDYELGIATDKQALLSKLLKMIHSEFGAVNTDTVAQSPDLQQHLLDLSFWIEDPTVRRPFQDFLLTLMVQTRKPREAIDLIFKDYAVQGVIGGTQILETLDGIVSKKDDIHYLSTMARERLKDSLGDETAGTAVLADGGIEMLVPKDKKTDLLSALIRSRSDDKPIRTMLGDQWWQGYSDDITQIFFDWALTLIDGSGDIKSPDEMENSLKDLFFYPELAESAYGNIKKLYFSPQDVLNLIYRLGPMERTAILRKFLMHALGNPANRERIFDDFFTTYVDQRGESDSSNLIKTILETLVTTAPNDELVLMVTALLEPRVGRPPAAAGSWSDINETYANDVWDVIRESEEMISLKDDWFPNGPSGRDKRTWEKLQDRFMDPIRNWLKNVMGQSSSDPLRIPEIDQLVSNVIPTDFLRSNSGSTYTSMTLMLDVARQLGAPGVRFLQLLGQVVDIPEEYQKEFSTVYDRSRGQTKVAAMQTIEKALPEFAKEIDRFGRRMGGGSLYTVFEVFLKNGDREVVRVLNPNARYHARIAIKIISETIAAMSDKDPVYAQAVPLIKLLEDWIEQELDDTTFEDDDLIFRKWDGWQPADHGFNMKIGVHETIPTYTPFVRREKVVDGVALTEVFSDSEEALKNWPIAKRKEIVAIGIQNYAAQIFAPIIPNIVKGNWGRLAAWVNKGVERSAHIINSLKGRPSRSLIHSDISLGNFILSNTKTEGDTLSIIDRGMYLEFTTEELAFFQKIFKEKQDSTESVNEFVQSLWNLSLSQEMRDKLTAKGISPESITREITWNFFISPEKREELAVIGITEANITPDIVRASASKINFQKVGLKILAHLHQKGLLVPLKENLLIKNLNAWEDMARKAGFEPASEGSSALVVALEYNPSKPTPEGQPGSEKITPPLAVPLMLPFGKVAFWGATFLVPLIGASVIIGLGWIAYQMFRMQRETKQLEADRIRRIEERLSAQRELYLKLQVERGTSDLTALWPGLATLELDRLNGSQALLSVLHSKKSTDRVIEHVEGALMQRPREFSEQTAMALLRKNLALGKQTADDIDDNIAYPVQLTSDDRANTEIKAIEALHNRLQSGKTMVLLLDSQSPGATEFKAAVAARIPGRSVKWVEKIGGYIIGNELQVGMAAEEIKHQEQAIGSLVFVIPTGVSFQPSALEMKLFNNSVRFALMETLTSILVIEHVDAENLVRIARAMAIQA